jgi:hypothetical protein
LWPRFLRQASESLGSQSRNQDVVHLEELFEASEFRDRNRLFSANDEAFTNVGRVENANGLMLGVGGRRTDGLSCDSRDAYGPGPPRSEPSTPTLGCPGGAPKHIHGAVRPPFLHPERGLVPKACALNYYPGDAKRLIA